MELLWSFSKRLGAVMLDPLTSRISLTEYLRIDAASQPPLEFIDRYAVAQAVSSGNHEQITVNLAALLALPVKAAGCRQLLAG